MNDNVLGEEIFGRFTLPLKTRDEMLEWERKKARYVYFILNRTRNLIKIGWSRNPENRLNLIKNFSVGGCCLNEDLVLLGQKQCLNAMEFERILHSKFEFCRVQGEWFDAKRFADFILKR